LKCCKHRHYATQVDHRENMGKHACSSQCSTKHQRSLCKIGQETYLESLQHHLVCTPIQLELTCIIFKRLWCWKQTLYITITSHASLGSIHLKSNPTLSTMSVPVGLVTNTMSTFFGSTLPHCLRSKPLCPHDSKKSSQFLPSQETMRTIKMNKEQFQSIPNKLCQVW
jgi:hypothetical protein